jgi:hypothetical protein
VTLNLRQLAKEREDATVDKADLFDFYNKNWDALIAEIARLREIDGVDLNLACDECDANIPDVAGGSLANKHHDESCSLYDPDEE